MRTMISASIVDLNNQALSHMMKGDLNETVGTLGTALSNLKMYQDLEKVLSASQQQSCYAPQAQQQQPCFLDQYGCSASAPILQQHYAPPLQVPPSGACCPPMTSVALTIPASLLANTSSTTTSLFGLFHRALTVPNSDALFASKGNTDRVMAMLLYNMGLSVHLQALSSGKNSELDGALQLYEMAFTVVEDSWSNFDNVDDLMLLLMALFNNMGHIHSSRFDLERTQICLDWLRTLAANPMFQSFMAQAEYAPFFMNLLVALKQERHVCSPAA